MIDFNPKKREVATLVPYKKEEGNFYFYLQKRDKGTKIFADMFGLFGGKMEEGENPEQGMLREIKEELSFTPEGYRFISLFEDIDTRDYMFAVEVGNDFESKVKVSEGEYGKFLSKEDLKDEKKVPLIVRYMVTQLAESLEK